MKITRNICGTDVQIELVDNEIMDAFHEYQNKMDEQEMNDALAITCKYNEIPADVLKELTQMMRMRLDNAGANSAFHTASKIIEDNETLLEPYKKEEPWALFEIECTQTRKKTWTVRAHNADEADKIFAEWREKHVREYDEEMADAELDDDDIDTAYACEGDPEYADITVE